MFDPVRHPLIDCSAPHCNDTAINPICIPSCIVSAMDCSAPRCDDTTINLICIPSCIVSTKDCSAPHCDDTTINPIFIPSCIVSATLSDMHMSSPSDHGGYDMEIPAIVLDSLLPEMVQRLCLSPWSTSMELVGKDVRSLPQEVVTMEAPSFDTEVINLTGED